MKFCSLFHVLSFCCTLAYAVPKSQFLQLHSLSNAIPVEWKWHGSVDEDSGYVYLTSKDSNEARSGSLWSTSVLRQVGWQLSTSFVAHVSENENTFFAIWYTSAVGSEGPVFGASDKWDGLLISQEIDQTGKIFVRGYLNDKSFELAQFTDPDLPPFAKCTIESSPEALNNIILKYGDQSGLELFVNDKPCFQVKDVILPQGYYFGVSSQSTSAKDLVALSNLNILPPDTSNNENLNPTSNTKQSVGDNTSPQTVIDTEGLNAIKADLAKLFNLVESQRQKMDSLHFALTNALERLNDISSTSQFPSERFNALEKLLHDSLSAQSSTADGTSKHLAEFEKEIKKAMGNAYSPYNLTNFMVFLLLGAIVSYGIMLVRRDRRRHKYL
ncbi:L-type lectin-like domain-containing protein C4F6.05c [Schizosaccharomyces pombe]